MKKRRAIRSLTAATIAAAIGAAGCNGPVRPDCPGSNHTQVEIRYDGFYSTPKRRIGCLPFPGLTSLYTTADAQQLGRHAYRNEFVSSDPEAERGILYTRRAGFVDLCHVRLAADLTAYAFPRVRHALEHDWTCFRIRGHEPSIFEISLDYPGFWFTIPDEERRELIDELAVRIAQDIAFVMTAWHELITWFGYKSTVVIPETGSAFTWEDIPSHAIGVLAAGDALRSDQPYDEALTHALAARIGDLEPTDAEGLEHATRAVEGDWWDDGVALKRYLDLGLENGRIEPLIAPPPAPQSERPHAVFTLPDTNIVRGHAFPHMHDIAIDPRIFESSSILERLPGNPTRVKPREHFPVLLEYIRNESR